MLYRMFSIYDNKALSFNAPFAMAHVGMAVRALQELANDRSTAIGRHPADYSLVEIGTYDDETGVMTSLPHQVHVTAAALVQPAMPQAPLFDAAGISAEQILRKVETEGGR